MLKIKSRHLTWGGPCVVWKYDRQSFFYLVFSWVGFHNSHVYCKDFSFLWGKAQKFTNTTQHYCSIFHFAISCTKSRLHSTVLPSWDNRAMLEKHKSFKMNGGFKKLCFYQPWAQKVCKWPVFLLDFNFWNFIEYLFM